MTIDLDALIAEVRAFTERSFLGRPEMRELDRAIMFTRRLADALEQSRAELRQERERARDAEERMRLLDQANDEEIDRTDKAEAALSRAEETIEKVRAVPNEFEWDVPPTAKRILTEYDKQKGESDD